MEVTNQCVTIVTCMSIVAACVHAADLHDMTSAVPEPRSALVLHWTGSGDGVRWSDPDNWAEQVSPVSGVGDTLVFDTTTGNLVSSNDISSLAISNISIGGGKTNTINGAEVVLTGTEAWSNQCPAVVNLPLRVTRAASSGEIQMRIWGMLTLNDRLTIDGGVNVRFSGRTYEDPNRLLELRCLDEIYGPQANLYLDSANSSLCEYHFYGKLTLASLWNATNWGATDTYVYSSGNAVGELVVAYQTMKVKAANAFPGATIKMNGYYRQKWGQLLSIAAGCDQTFDRISETGTTFETASATKDVSQTDCIGLTEGGIPTKLTLVGTSDATTAAKFMGQKIDLDWAPAGDFTQEFRNRLHEQTGSITVSGGTLRSSGENVFLNVPKVFVKARARLDIASAHPDYATFPNLRVVCLDDSAELVARSGTRPFPDTVTVYLNGSARLNVASDATVEIGHLATNNVEVAPGSYVDADWIVGGGTVNITGKTAEDSHVWWLPRDGDWNDGARWLGGVPKADGSAVLSNFGDYSVSFGPMDVLPKKMSGALDGTGTATVRLDGDFEWADAASFTIDAGVRVEVPTDSSVLWNNGKCLTVNGGELRVSGGNFQIAHAAWSVTLGGTVSHTGRVVVTAGVFKYSGAPYNGIALNDYSVFEASGGLVQNQPTSYSCSFFSYGGGSFKLSGDAIFQTSATIDQAFSYGRGESVYSGSSRYKVEKEASSFAIAAKTEGTVAKLTLRENAAFVPGDSGSGGFDGFNIGEGSLGMSVLEIDSDTPQTAVFGVRASVGCDGGKGEVIMRRGWFRTGYRGWAVGTSLGNRWLTGISASGGHGVFRMMGGGICIDGSTPVTTEALFNGLVIGEASMNLAQGEDLEHGEFYLSGGVVTNNNGILLIGGARATGYFEQTGGALLQDSGINAVGQTVVGLSGGRGSYLMGGGIAEMNRHMYVGGCPIEEISNYQYLDDFYPYPYDRHDATGVLTVTGGVLNCAQSLFVGADGSGSLKIVGSEAEVNVAQNLVLSNAVTGVSTATLTFDFDENGVSPINVAGKVVNWSGTKLIVRLPNAEIQRSRRRLISCLSWEGPAIVDTTFVGVRSDVAKLRSDVRGIYVSMPTAGVIFIR